MWERLLKYFKGEPDTRLPHEVISDLIDWKSGDSIVYGTGAESYAHNSGNYEGIVEGKIVLGLFKYDRDVGKQVYSVFEISPQQWQSAGYRRNVSCDLRKKSKAQLDFRQAIKNDSYNEFLTMASEQMAELQEKYIKGELCGKNF